MKKYNNGGYVYDSGAFSAELEDETAKDGKYGLEMDGVSASKSSVKDAAADKAASYKKESADIADQIDGLLYDMTNVVLDSENSVVSNLKVLNTNVVKVKDALINFYENLNESLEISSADREEILNAVMLTKAVLSGGAPVNYGQDFAGASKSEVEALRAEVNALRESSQRNAQMITDEIRRFRDHMLIISMAKVEDEDTVGYESYNEILLSEIKSLKSDLENMDTLVVPTASVAATSEAPQESAPAAPAPVVKKAPPKPVVKRTAPPVRPRKIITPATNSDLTINEILKKIGDADVKISKE